MGNHWTMSEKGREKISRFARERYKDSSVLTECKNCNKQIKVPKSRYEGGKGKYCSKECQYTDKKGVRNSIDTEFKKGQNVGKQNVNWKGDNVTRESLHTYINRVFKKPAKCELCGISRNKGKGFEWSNKSQTYRTKDRSDWQYICKKCHVEFDDVATKAWNTRRFNLLNKNNE